MMNFPIFIIIIIIIPLRITFVLGAQKSLIRNVGQDVVFKWNRTSGSIDEVRWGLVDDKQITLQFIYVESYTNVAVYGSALNTPAGSSYKGRVHYVGVVPAGRAWFKITNLSISDTNDKYGITIIPGPVNTVYKMSLTVAATPKFQPHPPLAKNITEGQDLSIPCTAVGPPTPNITWVQIAGDMTKSTGTGSATLRIPNIRRDQNGTYECQARNNPNERPVTTQTVVTVYYPPQASLTSSSTTVVQGNQIVLSCTAVGSPPPSISWTKADGVIKAGHTVAGGTLRIPDAIKTDAGKYICTAKNTYDSKEHFDTATATVVVKYQPSILLDKLQNQIRTFNESGSLTLKCEADGNPTPTIKWKTPKESVHTGKVLDISSVNQSDAGTYICMASNRIVGEVNASIQVTIQYKPVIDENDSSSTNESWNGHNVSLRCFATGLPEPRISWYKPTNQQITKGVNIVPGGSEVTVLTTADQGDYGQYKCRATNILGSDEHVINVTELFPPGHVIITLTEIEASSVTVRWTKPADDGGRPVIDHKVEINSSEATVNKLNTHAIITKLKENTKYLVKVSAKNVVGYGNVSTKAFSTLKQGPPGVPELTFTVEHTTGLSVRLTWTKPEENGGVITKYTIYMKEDGDSEWIKDDDVTDPSKQEYNVTQNIEYGKRYKVIVTSWNKYGESKRDDVLAKTFTIPNYKPTATPTTSARGDPSKDERTSGKGGPDGLVIGIAVGAVLFMLIVAVILGVIIVRKKGLLSKGFGRKSPSNRAAYDNDVDPDSAAHQAAASGLGGAEDGIPTYAAVDMTKKKKKPAQDDIPNYAVVDKSKKKRPGEIIYAELADFNTAGSAEAAAAAGPRPITYTGTDYADIAQFQKQDEEEPTYANFPGRGKNYTNIQGLPEDQTFQI